MVFVTKHGERTTMRTERIGKGRKPVERIRESLLHAV
jgi:hypothetical protein